MLHGNSQLSFQVGAYDRSRPLVIDPVLSYSTFLGGSNGAGLGIAVDSSGNAFVTGNNAGNAFVAKLNASGTQLLYSSYLGGVQSGSSFGIAVDSDDNAYVTGDTDGTNFPTTTYLGPPGGGEFIAKFGPTGSLQYATILGATFTYAGLAVDRAGDAYVTGSAGSNFQTLTTPSAHQKVAPGPDGRAFVAKLDRSGTQLLYATFLGGSGGETANGIAVDSSGNVYVTGTAGSNFPMVNAYQSALCNPLIQNAFVAKLNTNSSGTASLVYSTLSRR